MKLKAVIAYDGSRFLGFQRQSYTTNTIAGTIEQTLKKIQIDCKIVASGRTDKGVHATHQVIHFEAPHFWNDLQKLQHLLNMQLFEKGIYFKTLQQVNENFHARFSAKRRSYLYIMKPSPTVFEQSFVAKYGGYDLSKFIDALHCFKGTHDFEFFSKSGSEAKSSIRTIDFIWVKRYKNYTFCSIKANGFLRSQIRMMVGASLEVAYAKTDISQIKTQLQKQSTHFTTLAKGEGLYLSNVEY